MNCIVCFKPYERYKIEYMSNAYRCASCNIEVVILDDKRATTYKMINDSKLYLAHSKTDNCICIMERTGNKYSGLIYRLYADKIGHLWPLFFMKDDDLRNKLQEYILLL